MKNFLIRLAAGLAVYFSKLVAKRIAKKHQIEADCICEIGKLIADGKYKIVKTDNGFELEKND